MSVLEKLAEIQSTLEAPKDQYNSFGKYKYRSLEGIIKAVKPLLKEHKCLLVISDDVDCVGDRVYVEAIAKLICTETKEEIEVSGYAREAETQKGMNDAQITGSASSYARKYACNGLFAIDDTKDPDSTNKHGKESKTATDRDIKRRDEYLVMLQEVADESTKEVFKAWWGIPGNGDKIKNTLPESIAKEIHAKYNEILKAK